MRPTLIALAATVFIAAPAAAQDREAETMRGAAGAIQQAAPALDRAANSMLDLDIGPLIDATKPYGPNVRHHRTLRQMAHRNDPYFEQHLRDSIYGATARASRTMAALAASEPALRQSLMQMEANVRAAMRGIDAYDVSPRGDPRYDGPPPEAARPYDAEPGPPESAPPGDADDEGPEEEPFGE